MDDQALITYACRAMPYLQEMPKSPHWRGAYPWHFGGAVTHACYGGDVEGTTALMAAAIRAQHQAWYSTVVARVKKLWGE